MRPSERILKWFPGAHPEKFVNEIQARFREFAVEMDELLPESAEKTTGLRKILEGKDCLVRAALDASETGWLPPREGPQP